VFTFLLPDRGGCKNRPVDVYAKNNVKIVGKQDGPTVMLAHGFGFGCDQNQWRLVAEQLTPRFRVVLFDHVGAGSSDPSAWNDGV
jgi:sigma-B regulation protein RsbQ